MKIKKKVLVHNEYVLPVIVYGSGLWALKKAHIELTFLSVAQRQMERIMLGITNDNISFTCHTFRETFNHAHWHYFPKVMHPTYQQLSRGWTSLFTKIIITLYTDTNINRTTV